MTLHMYAYMYVCTCIYIGIFIEEGMALGTRGNRDWRFGEATDGIVAIQGGMVAFG